MESMSRGDVGRGGKSRSREQIPDDANDHEGFE